MCGQYPKAPPNQIIWLAPSAFCLPAPTRRENQQVTQLVFRLFLLHFSHERDEITENHALATDRRGGVL